MHNIETESLTWFGLATNHYMAVMEKKNIDMNITAQRQQVDCRTFNYILKKNIKKHCSMEVEFVATLTVDE